MDIVGTVNSNNEKRNNDPFLRTRNDTIRKINHELPGGRVVSWLYLILCRRDHTNENDHYSDGMASDSGRNELIEKRWDFFVPCCAALKNRVHYWAPRAHGTIWFERKRFLEVTIPTQRDFDFRWDVPLKGYDGTSEFQKVRELLALLCAVAHIDHAAWRYLLEKHCRVQLGSAGYEVYEDKIPTRLVLILDTSYDGKPFEGQYNYDLLQFCGVDQRHNPSLAYSSALAKIGKLAGDQTELNIQVPVKVFFSGDWGAASGGSLAELMDIVYTERKSAEEWAAFDPSQANALASLRLTFVLEPIIAS